MVWLGVLLSLALGIAPLRLQTKPSVSDMLDGKPIQDAEGKEYRLIEGEMTWEEAYQRCDEMNPTPSPGYVYDYYYGYYHFWYVASLPTNEEFEEIAGKVQNLLSGSTCAETWVGLTRYGDDWYWAATQGLVSSDDKRWASGEPRNEDDLADVAFVERGQLMSSKRDSKRCSVLCVKM